MSRPLINPVAVVLAANGTQQVSVTGDYILIVSASGAFNLQIDGGQNLPVLAGLAIPCDGLFTNLTFTDTSGGANSITAIVSDQKIAYYPPQTTVVSKDAPTVLVATTLRTLAGNTTKDFTGLSLAGSPAGAGKTRRWISVSNEDAANPLEVWDSANAAGQTIVAGRSQIYFTSGDFKVRNPNGAALNVTVLEAFYI